MVYTDPEHFESIYFDLWLSFKDHGWSKQSMVDLPYMAKGAIFDHVMDTLSELPLQCHRLKFQHSPSCMTMYVSSACMSLLVWISKPMAKC